MKKTEYTLSKPRFGRDVLFALVSDLHGEDPSEVIALLRQEKPNYILMPGDIFERLDGAEDGNHVFGLRLLTEAAKIAPVYYSMGNHEDGGVHSWNPFWKLAVKERTYHERDLERIRESGAILLQDSYVIRDGVAFGGLQSGLINKGQRPNTDWLRDFCSLDMPRVLLCHHPEYYKTCLRSLPLDLIVSGHAHGGQWRFFGRGVFAPGQGIFPKYTYGVHEDRFVIGTGLKKGSLLIPRFFNEPEVVFIRTK